MFHDSIASFPNCLINCLCINITAGPHATVYKIRNTLQVREMRNTEGNKELCEHNIVVKK